MDDPVRKLLRSADLQRELDAGNVEIEPRAGGNPFQPSHRVYLRKGNELDSLGGGSVDRLNRLWRVHRDEWFERNIDDPLKPRIVAIGDSWFHYPFGSDLLEWFMKDYALKTLASAGDVLSRMSADRDYAPHIASVKPHFFMVSGGGNDLLGEGPGGERNIKRMLIDFDPGAADWITPEGRETIGELISHFETILADLLSLGFNGRMVVHGYDYASPSSRGPWLSEPLEQKGYLSDTTQLAAIVQLVNAFRDAITAWALPHGARVMQVDCAGLNGRGSLWWFDEIHPTMTGYVRRLLPKFRSVMDAA